MGAGGQLLAVRGCRGTLSEEKPGVPCARHRKIAKKKAFNYVRVEGLAVLTLVF